MQQISKTFETNPACKTCCTVASVLAGALFCTTTVYLGIYGYNSPDPKACWVVRDLDTGFTTKLEAEERARTAAIEV